MEARIRKLRVEEEKAKKRISDARREQDLVKDMKSTKNKWLSDKITNNRNLKDEENYNRNKIHDERARNRAVQEHNRKMRNDANAKTNFEIKTQKNRINDAINTFKNATL